LDLLGGSRETAREGDSGLVSPNLRRFGLHQIRCICGSGSFPPSVVATRKILQVARREVWRHHGECRSPNDPSFCEWLGAQGTDILLVTVSFILGENLLGVPRLGTINKHAALLPANRGLFPYFWAKLHATAQGISYHLVTPGIDEGPLLVQDRDVPATCLGTMVRFYLHVFGTFPEQMRAAVSMLAASTTLTPLPGIGASYYSQPSRAQVADFRRAGGHIISITDIARAWAL
jgi:hypothetical protein